MSSDKTPAALQAPTRRQLVFFSWTKDVLIYVVVLNLFVEYVDKIVIDSFTISILTAILLKALLDLILGLEHRVAHFFEARPGNLSKFLRIMSTWFILFLSKFRWKRKLIWTNCTKITILANWFILFLQV